MDRSMSLTTSAGASTGLSIVGAPTPVPRVSLLVPVRRHLPGILSSSPPNPRRARIRTPVRSQPALFPFRKDRKSTRLNSSHGYISYAVFCLKKKKTRHDLTTGYTIHSQPRSTTRTQRTHDVTPRTIRPRYPEDHGKRCYLCRSLPMSQIFH